MRNPIIHPVFNIQIKSKKTFVSFIKSASHPASRPRSIAAPRGLLVWIHTRQQQGTND